jgi:hypothetical protein
MIGLDEKGAIVLREKVSRAARLMNVPPQKGFFAMTMACFVVLIAIFASYGVQPELPTRVNGLNTVSFIRIPSIFC